MMPSLAERSISENVLGSSSAAALPSLPVSARRMARIWCRRRVLFLRFTSVRRSVARTRLIAEIVFSIFGLLDSLPSDRAFRIAQGEYRRQLWVQTWGML